MNPAKVTLPCHSRTFHPQKTKAVCAVVAHTAFALPGGGLPSGEKVLETDMECVRQFIQNHNIGAGNSVLPF